MDANTKKVESIYRKMIAEKTDEERLLMGFSMFDFEVKGMPGELFIFI